MSRDVFHPDDAGGFSPVLRGALPVLEAPGFPSAGRIVHAFLTRQGGVSAGPYASLNLGFRTGDPADRVRENLSIVARAFGIPPERFVLLDQRHGDGILVLGGSPVGRLGRVLKNTRMGRAVQTCSDARRANTEERGVYRNTSRDEVCGATPQMSVFQPPDRPEYHAERGVGLGTVLSFDAVATDQEALALCIRTADCVPILLADPVRRVVAAVHAGWRGTVMDIVGKTVRVLASSFGCHAGDLSAALGPAIGPCCYEVDGTVRDAWKRQAGEAIGLRNGRSPGHWMFDLHRANRLLLERAGVRPEKILSCAACTSCRKDRYFSHRGDGGITGRQLNFIALSPLAGGRGKKA